MVWELQAMQDRMERMEALGHDLPGEVMTRILSFEPYPVHPVAALIKKLDFIQVWDVGARGTMLCLYGPDRCFKRYHATEGFGYYNFFYLRLWRTLSPDWAPCTDTHARF